MTVDYDYRDVVEGIRSVGITRGDVVLVHSALFSLGLMKDVSPAGIPARIYEAFREVIGEEGTLVVPAAFNDYARRGIPYDRRKSPVDKAQGVFSQCVANLPGAVRTICPMLGAAAIGPLAEEMCGKMVGSSLGAGSTWDELLNHDAKMCFLGVRPAKAFTFVLLIQTRHGVPYLYHKLYQVPVTDDGRPISVPIVNAVRYLNPAFRISENCDPFEDHLFAKGLIQTGTIGRGHLFSLSSTKQIFAEGLAKIRENLYYFLQEPPTFVPGEIPTDGVTGVAVPEELRFQKP
jgi:aminoglycoside N3'-acetyltransferase